MEKNVPNIQVEYNVAAIIIHHFFLPVIETLKRRKKYKKIHKIILKDKN